MIQDFKRDALHTLRSLRRNPGAGHQRDSDPLRCTQCGYPSHVTLVLILRR
jgi:hypothetical protein